LDLSGREGDGRVSVLFGGSRRELHESARWQAVIADQLKPETYLSNAWLAATLHMGSSTYVSKQVGQVRSARLRANSPAGTLVER